MLILKILLLFLLSSATGWLLVQVSWRLAVGRWPGWLLSASLGLGLGAGLAACLYSFNLFISNASPISRVYLGLEGALLLGLLAGWIVLKRRAGVQQAEQLPAAPLPKWFLAVFGVALALGLAYFVKLYFIEPLGGWDAVMVWNMHAKFIALGGPAWQKMLSQPSKPSYPLLVPAYIARFWHLLGRDSSYASMLTAGLFTFGGLGLLMAFLKEVRGWKTALVGGLILVCSPGYISVGANQYADIPIAFFFLAALGLILLYDLYYPQQRGLLALAGLCASLALWTKQEGWLMLIALLGARLLWLFLTRRLGQGLAEAGWFLAGLAPGLLLVLYYRGITPRSDMLIAPARQFLQLFKLHRYLTVWNEMNAYFVNIGKWTSTSAVLVLALLALGLGIRLREGEGRPFAYLGLVIALLLVGYFFTFIVTPYPLVWQAQGSLTRLMLHLYTAFLLLVLPLIKFEPAAED